MTEDNNYCIGCLSYTGCYITTYRCLFDHYNDKGQCPCSNCIIKCMCDVPCEDFSDFRLSTVERGVEV